ncbi:hypothetical protein VM98_33730 [Streptomyces rubellomurinus subsp. indigoferus]|nr:hypothetical protein VM98_33730 [Streptomyces rubellomurinus subsp. indigoferus]
MFLRGFGEAIGVAVVLVAVDLALNVGVVANGLCHVLKAPQVVTDWSDALPAEYGKLGAMLGVSLTVVPVLARGLPGFETGVAVTPHITG